MLVMVSLLRVNRKRASDFDDEFHSYYTKRERVYLRFPTRFQKKRTVSTDRRTVSTTPSAPAATPTSTTATSTAATRVTDPNNSSNQTRTLGANQTVSLLDVIFEGQT
jgi:hypothetical protein